MNARRRDLRQKRRRRRLSLIIPLSVLGVLVIAGAVVSFIIIPKALDARDGLEKAIPLVTEVQTKMLAGDTAGAAAAADALAQTAATSHAQTSDPLWLSLEWLPVLGENLRAVRMATASVDELAREVLVPVSTISVASFVPVDGKLDLEAFIGLGAILDRAAAAVDKATANMDSINESALVGPVAGGVARIDSALAQARDLIGPAESVVDALPGILGAEGPRDVLVIFQNNGEITPRGGTTGSLAQLHIEDGAITIVAQSSASRAVIPMYDDDIVPVADDAHAIYGPGLGKWVQQLTRTPRFDLSFEIAREFWKRTHGVEVDAIVSLDTVALSYLLVATGPITVPPGLEISNENAVALLLGDLYRTYSPPEVDAINQAFAGLTVLKLMTGSADVVKLASLIGRAADEGRVMIWSARDNEQQLIAGSPFDGRLGEQTETTDTFGVYFVDDTPGKMQRYMTQAVDIAQAACGDGRRVRVTVTLKNTVVPEDVRKIPFYVTGDGGATPKGSMRVTTMSYAPAGYSLLSQTERTGTDGEYSVAVQGKVIGPSEEAVMVFDYLADSDAEKTLDLDVTPAVTPTVVTSGTHACN